MVIQSKGFCHPNLLRRPFQPKDHLLVQRAAVAAGGVLDLLTQGDRNAEAIMIWPRFRK
jgi:hypothetical protein